MANYISSREDVNFGEQAYNMLAQSTKYAVIRGIYGFMFVAAGQYRSCLRHEYRDCASSASFLDIPDYINCRMDAKDHCQASTNFTAALVGGVVAAVFPQVFKVF